MSGVRWYLREVALIDSAKIASAEVALAALNGVTHMSGFQ